MRLKAGLQTLQIAISPEERLIAEQAILNLRELNKTCDAAPHGKVFAIAETMAVNQGREFICKSLESSLATQATDVEKNGTARTCSCNGAREHCGKRRQKLMTAAGQNEQR